MFVSELHKGQTFLTGISSNRIRGVYLDVYRRREEQRLEKGEEREAKARGGDSLPGREDDMATGAGADARNPSHRGKVAGGLWWPLPPDLAAWEGAAV